MIAKRVLKIFALFSILPIISGLLWWAQRSSHHVAASEELKAAVPAYFEKDYKPFLAEHGRPDLAPVHALAPPVVPVAARATERFIYWGTDLETYAKLPLADDLARVGTIALSIEDTSMYTMGALTYDATVVFIDVRTKTVVARKHFKADGSLGARITLDEMKQWDDAFWTPVADWIKTIPFED